MVRLVIFTFVLTMLYNTQTKAGFAWDERGLFEPKTMTEPLPYTMGVINGETARLYTTRINDTDYTAGYVGKEFVSCARNTYGRTVVTVCQ